MLQINHDFGIVVGDIDQLLGNNYDVNYFSHYTKMTKNVCHFTTIGNHDTLTNQTNYTDAFYLPHNNPANTELYYSFTWGNAKFIALDGNINCDAGSPQYAWLESQLKCNNSEWLFVFFHQPPWTNAWDITYDIPFQYWYQYQGNADMRTSLVPLFEQYHVDAVLNGHAHDYQRGVYNGVHYFIAGGGGTSDPDTHTNSNSPNIQYEQDVNNFMHFSIRADSVHFYALGLNGVPVDSGSFTKVFTPYSAYIAAQNVGCGAAGSALAQVSGPRSPYSFVWSNGSTASLDTALSVGTYYLTITDSSGCVTNDSVVIIAADTVLHEQIEASVTAGFTAQLSASAANAGTYTWVLGNGVTLTDTSYYITYTYADTGTYIVRLITVENCGTDTSTALLLVNGNTTNGILNVGSNNFTIRVFPNPFKNETSLLVNGPVSAAFDARIYNLQGQLVRSLKGSTGSNLTVNANGLAAGYYLLNVTVNQVTTTFKLVVQ
jgi:hypothetical protein